MGKFRSKLKGATKGRRWGKGQSSSCNPATSRHRDIARSKLIHENLGNDSGLTRNALKKHDAIHIFGHGLGDVRKSENADGETSIANSLRDISLCDAGDDAGESEANTFKTFQTFASDWSACSNASFARLLKGFDPKCALHKEMLAILAAITEVIKEKGGCETSTEYFAALMETLKVTEADESLTAILSLLSMGLKSVPRAVLVKQFSESVSILAELLEKYSDSDSNVILRCVIGCLSVFLRAQDYATWSDQSTMKIFESLLAFAIHSKPKVRKAAQHAVCAILRGSSFMLPSDDANQKVVKLHPAANRVAAMCISQMKAQVLLSSQTTMLHILTLLTDVLPYFSKDCIKSSCESLLSLMTQNDIIVKTWCLKALHSLFVESNESSHLTAALAVRLVRALTAYRPSALDARQALAWITVVQHAFLRLARLDLAVCMSDLPKFVHICVSELWLCDNMDIISTTSNALKAILVDCVKPASDGEENSIKYWSSMESIFKSIKTGLDNPFNRSTKQVILTIGVCFEVGNDRIKPLLAPLLKHLNERRESINFVLIKEMEYATGCAVKHLGPQFVLECIPLESSKDTVNLERSWLLIVLKEKVQNSTLKFFTEEILTMASMCRNRSKAAATLKNETEAHTYELLCSQLWALLPNFCNNPSDVKENFKGIARILGTVIKDNKDFRPSVMQGLRKLISSTADDPEDSEQVSRFAKNFLPLLLNVYMTPGTSGHDTSQHLAVLETIRVYLTIAPQSLRQELFQNSLKRLECKSDYHSRESLLDVIGALALYQSDDKISSLFETWIYPLCENTGQDLKKVIKKKKESKSETEEDKVDLIRKRDEAKTIEMEHKKAYRILEEIFRSDKENCKTFLLENRKKIQKMLMQSLSKSADNSKASRLKCIQYLIKSQPNLDHESKLLKTALPEAVVYTRDINSKCRQCAFDLMVTIGETLQSRDDGLDRFTAMLETGLQGAPNIVTATVCCLATATYNFSAALGVHNLQRIMENVCQLMKTSDRQVVGACIAFLKVYTKTLPSPLVAGSLPIVFNSIAEMCEDCKRHTRTDLANLLTKLTRKFGTDTVAALIPESDVGMHRKLRYMRKMDSRKKRIKEARRNDRESDDEIQIKGSSKTLEEILKDSDSELDVDDDDEANRKRSKSNKKVSQTWIREDENNILDLMDPSSAKNITATRPAIDGDKNRADLEKAKKKREIKTAPDGKLMLNFDDDSESENETRKRPKDSDDSDEVSDDDASAAETMLLSAGRKRKHDDIKSQKSGKTGFSSYSSVSKYRTGGKGIHRNTNASVKSDAGSEYRSKKARGDMKRKGKPDPYAYVPLVRSSLNKRKRMKNVGQFNNIIKGAQKGAAVGRISKSKMRVKSKK